MHVSDQMVGRFVAAGGNALLSAILRAEAEARGVAGVYAVPTSLEALRDRRAEFLAASQALIGLADEEDRDLTDEELASIQGNSTEAERLQRQIQAREAVQPQGRPGENRRTSAEPRDQAQGGGARTVPAQARGADAGRGPWRSFGEFAVDVRSAGIGNVPQRLQAAATTFGNEGTGADGGFAVPPDFRREIWQKVMGEENLLSRCAPLVSASNSITIPKDETAPWDTSNGIQVYWESEAGQVSQSKPQLSMSTLRLAKLMALVPVSDELLEDATGLESWLRAKAPAKMSSKINTAIISGTGVGQPLGILTALTGGATISVGAETSQPSATVYFANINKMWARLYAPCRRNAVWLINQDIEPQLDAMAFDPAATSKTPVYLPQGGLSAEPYALLKNRPVVPIEACSTLGTQGDIILADLTQYWGVTRGQSMQTDVSMHLYFDQGTTAFRFTFRMNGAPAWGSAISPQNGSNTRSWAVTLDPR